MINLPTFLNKLTHLCCLSAGWCFPHYVSLSVHGAASFVFMVGFSLNLKREPSFMIERELWQKNLTLFCFFSKAFCWPLIMECITNNFAFNILSPELHLQLSLPDLSVWTTSTSWYVFACSKLFPLSDYRFFWVSGKGGKVYFFHIGCLV